jgi:uncharacterized protein YmfQ (DUF2313 family)
MSDLHLDQLRALLPPGAAMPAEAGSRLDRLLGVAAGEMARIDARVVDLRGEIQPAIAVELLADYERLLGPDPCLGAASDLSLAGRQAVAQRRWVAEGGSTPAFFVALGESLGVPVEVLESRPFEVGLVDVDDELIEEEGRFDWIISVLTPALASEGGGSLMSERGALLRIDAPRTTLSAFEVGVSDVDTPIEGFLASVIECFARRLAPAHTRVFFRY